MARYERKAQSQPKHGLPSSSGASKAPPPLSLQRPGWKGPGYIKKTARQPPKPAPEAAPPAEHQVIPETLQQLVLDVFREAFPVCNEFDELKEALREIREALAEQDYERAFGSEENLEKYTIRWSPSKALACGNVLAWLCEECEDAEWFQSFSGAETMSNGVSCGRGSAGFMALVMVLKHLHPGAAGKPSVPEDVEGLSEELGGVKISNHPSAADGTLLNVRLVDTTDWSSIMNKLSQVLTTPRPLSQYASAKARASNNAPLSPEALTWTMTQQDVLDVGLEQLRSQVGPGPTLITLFFTLGELYSRSISKTSAFLLRLTAAAPKGSLLLVVDEPGVVVESQTGYDKESEDRYPMPWLMRQVLTPKQPAQTKKNEDKKAPLWEQVVTEDNCIYRLPRGLAFPASLENVKYQMHLFQRL